jgi:hypothetical protein
MALGMTKGLLRMTLPRCRLKWGSGVAYADMYDAAPTATNASNFLHIYNNDLVINCKRWGHSIPSQIIIVMISYMMLQSESRTRYILQNLA